MTVSTNPYTSQAISGYNSSPPPDDGSTGADNLVTWDKHKTKLADPIRTLAENINTQLTTAFAKTINADASVRNQVDGSVAFAWATATIGNSIVAPLSSAAYLSGATTDTVFEIQTANVYDGAILTLKTLSASDSITLIHATATGAATATAANIYLPSNANVVIGDQYRAIELVYDSGTASGWIRRDQQISEVLGTEATATGATVDFTGLPSGVKRIALSFEGVSADGADNVLVQVGDSGGIEADGYNSNSTITAGNGTGSRSNATDGYQLHMGHETRSMSGIYTMQLSDSGNNTWIGSGTLKAASGTVGFMTISGGDKSLSGELTQVRVTLDGTASFDAGALNILYE